MEHPDARSEHCNARVMSQRQDQAEALVSEGQTIEKCTPTAEKFRSKVTGRPDTVGEQWAASASGPAHAELECARGLHRAAWEELDVDGRIPVTFCFAGLGLCKLCSLHTSFPMVICMPNYKCKTVNRRFFLNNDFEDTVYVTIDVPQNQSRFD